MKPKRSRSGPGSSPARVVAPTRVNGATSSAIARRARALADDDVDPEVLHRHVEQLLGGPRHPVDLVEEQHLALAEVEQQRGEVAGPLDRRPAGDPQPGAELGGDDHRQRRLAEPGRPGQQDVVRRPAAAHGAPSSTSASCSRTRACPTNSASVRGRSAASTSRSSSAASGGDRTRSLVRAVVITAAVSGASSRPDAGQPQQGDVGSVVRRRPGDRPRRRCVGLARGVAEPSERRCATCRARPVRVAATGRRHRRRQGGPSRSLSSRISRCAPLRPIPGTAAERVMSSSATAGAPRRADGRRAPPGPAAARRRSRSAAPRTPRARRRRRSRRG